VGKRSGEGFVRLNGSNLAEALKACGGMVDFKLSNPLAPTLFSTNGYQIVVMPMITDKAQEYAKKQAEAKAKAEPAEVAEPVAEPVKARHSRAKQPVKTA